MPNALTGRGCGNVRQRDTGRLRPPTPPNLAQSTLESSRNARTTQRSECLVFTPLSLVNVPRDGMAAWGHWGQSPGDMHVPGSASDILYPTTLICDVHMRPASRMCSKGGVWRPRDVACHNTSLYIWHMKRIVTPCW